MEKSTLNSSSNWNLEETLLLITKVREQLVSFKLLASKITTFTIREEELLAMICSTHLEIQKSLGGILTSEYLKSLKPALSQLQKKTLLSHIMQDIEKLEKEYLKQYGSTYGSI